MSVVTADTKDLTANITLRPWVKVSSRNLAEKIAVDIFVQFNLVPLSARLSVMGIPWMWWCYFNFLLHVVLAGRRTEWALLHLCCRSPCRLGTVTARGSPRQPQQQCVQQCVERRESTVLGWAEHTWICGGCQVSFSRAIHLNPAVLTGIQTGTTPIT